jgi:hypothetical protein
MTYVGLDVLLGWLERTTPQSRHEKIETQILSVTTLFCTGFIMIDVVWMASAVHHKSHVHVQVRFPPSLSATSLFFFGLANHAGNDPTIPIFLSSPYT